MDGICIGTVFFVGVVVTLVVFGGLILTAIRIRHGGLSRKTRKSHDDETAVIQESFNGLSRMEKRLEALETILLDR